MMMSQTAVTRKLVLLSTVPALIFPLESAVQSVLLKRLVMRNEEDQHLSVEDQERLDLREDRGHLDLQDLSLIWDHSWVKWSNKVEKKDHHQIPFPICKLKLDQ